MIIVFSLITVFCILVIIKLHIHSKNMYKLIDYIYDQDNYYELRDKYLYKDYFMKQFFKLTKWTYKQQYPELCE